MVQQAKYAFTINRLSFKASGRMNTTFQGLQSESETSEAPAELGIGSARASPSRHKQCCLSPNSLTFAFLVVAIVALLGISPSSVCAQNFNLAQVTREHLITQGVGEETGNLAIYVSFPNWFGRSGYCPIRVRVVPRKGLQFKQDGQLKVIVGVGNYSPFSSTEPNRQIVVEVPIEAGTSEAYGETLGNLLIGSNSSRWELVNVFAKLNGRKLRSQNASIYSGGGANNYECKNLILISEESSKDDSRRSEALAEMKETGFWFSQEAFVRSSGSSVAYCDVRNMPSNWLFFTSLEGISIGFEDLARLDASGLECLNQYILGGGHFTINKVTNPYDVSSFLPIDLNRSYRSTKGPNGTVSNAMTSLIPFFEPPSLDLLEDTLWDDYQRALGLALVVNRRQIVFTPKSNRYRNAASGFYESLDEFREEMFEVGKAVIDSELASASYFASHFFDSLSKSKPTGGSLPGQITIPIFVAHGFGTVYLNNARRGDQSSQFDEVSNATVNPQTTTTSSKNRTHRLADGIGDDFWDWLIPSVGRTPAIPFLAFVVLFVGVGAPAIMYWSNRHKRRVWLVILMPLMATACTIFLFSYGLLKDGFGSVTRSRSLSFIDEKGNGVVWSRQSYFAATVSNEGLLVGPETYFAPMPVRPYTEMPKCQQLDVEYGQQYLGALPPRLQTQFSISHPLRKLSIFKKEAEIDPILNGPSLLNDSNFTWSQAVFIGPKSEFFVASNVRHGERVPFAFSSREDAELILQKEYKSQSLVPPPDSPSADQTSLAQTFTGFFTWNNSLSNSTGQIVEELVWASHIGKSGNDQTVLQPNTFLIFAKEVPYLEKCLPTAKDQDGIHMIIGRW